MRGSKKRDLLKPIELFLMYLIFELAACLIKELPKGEGLSLKTFMGYFSPSYWFIFVYIALYLISPFINVMWEHLDRKGQKILLITAISLFSVYPMFCEVMTSVSGTSIWDEDSMSIYGLLQGINTVGITGSEGGYTIVNFVLMYLIGCYLREREDDIKKMKLWPLFVLLALNVFMIMVMVFAAHLITGNPYSGNTAWNYEDPLVISESVLIFMIFAKMKIKNSKLINILAGASFPSYLIHINILEFFGIEEAVNRFLPMFLLHAFVTIFGIYVISFVIYKLYDLCTSPVFKLISNKWKRRRFIEI